jgi:uncharacterized protein (TIGR03435 family)
MKGLSAMIARSCVAVILAMGSPLAHRAAAAQAQAPVTDGFEIRVSSANTISAMRTVLSGDRYELRNATVADLIRTAWAVGADDVVGGPEWLDTDRFDVIARTPADSSPERRQALLQQLLRDRFGLVTHSRTEALPAYIISVGSRSQLRPGNAAAVSGCNLQQNISTAPGMPRPPVTLVCENVTIGAFAQVLSDLREASGYLLGYPVLDRTGLRGSWKFRMTWTPRNAWHADPVAADGATIFDAFDTQLGLKLQLMSPPTVVVVIDSVRKPTAEQSPAATMRFEVADVRVGNPNDPALPCGHIDIRPGGQVHINMTLRSLLLESQGDFNPHRIIDRSNTLDAPCWEVRAKATVRPQAPLGSNGPEWNGVDIDSLRKMLRSLLEEHFGLVTHTEQVPASGYALIAANPKLRKADPANRPGCAEGEAGRASAPNRPDPRLANPMASRLITCRNATLAQFTLALNRLNTGIDGPVIDATRLGGRYDIAVNFSPGAWFHTAGSQQVPELIPIARALQLQLGLQLQPREVSEAVLVGDHIENRPLK